MNIKQTVLLVSGLALFSVFYTQKVNAFAYKYYAKKTVGYVLGAFCAGSVAAFVDPEALNWYSIVNKKNSELSNILFIFTLPAYVLRFHFTDEKNKDSIVKATLLQLAFIAATGYGSFQLLAAEKKKRRRRRKKRAKS